MSTQQDQLRWYGALLAGALPFLAAGFVASAIANRLVFIGWGLLTALLHAVLQRHGWQAGWRPRRLTGAALLGAALSVAALGVLAGYFADVLELGLRSYSFFHPLLIDPRTFFIPAGALLLTAAVLALPPAAR